MKKYYKIVDAETAVELEAKVNSHLEAGFTLVGGPLVTPIKTDKVHSYIHRVCFSQALYFEEE